MISDKLSKLLERSAAMSNMYTEGAKMKAQYGVDLPKTRLEMGEPIKSFGTYQVKAKLYTKVEGTVIVKVEEA